jgi:hypothetical protein
MSFKNVDIEGAMRRLADRRIEEAMREGKFDNLRGMGQPLDLEPMPADENARLAWWAIRTLRQNDFTPEEVRWRKQVDVFRDEIASASTERRVKALVAAHNHLVHQINTLGTNALNSPVAPVSLETELQNLSDRQAVATGYIIAHPPLLVCKNGTCRCHNPGEARFCRRCGNEMAIS